MLLPRQSPASLLVVVLAALVALTLIPGATGSAEASACKRWGHDNPRSLSHGEARKAVMCLIDKKRHSHGKSGLDRDRRLQRAGQGHTDRMKRRSCFSHQCPGEKSTLQRLQAVDYIESGLSRWSYGENIAYGEGRRGTPAAIVDAWMRSSPHRANILSGGFRDVGIGIVKGTPARPKGSGGTYTAVFGLRSG